MRNHTARLARQSSSAQGGRDAEHEAEVCALKEKVSTLQQLVDRLRTRVNDTACDDNDAEHHLLPEASAAPRTAAAAQADESTLDELQRLRRLLDRRDTSIEDAFTRADIDSSGDLTQAEWETAFGMSRALFARIDTDGDGKVSLKEFLDALARVPNSAGQLRQLLDKAQLVEVVAAHLEERAVREGGDAVCWVKEADPQTVARALVGLELRMAAAVVAAAGCHKEDDAPNDGASGGVGSKFQSDLTTVAAYGSIADYNDGLNSLGVPQADNYAGQVADTSHAPDSHDEFTTSNYGGTATTPKREWEFVVCVPCTFLPSYLCEPLSRSKCASIHVCKYVCMCLRRQRQRQTETGTETETETDQHTHTHTL